MGSATFATRLGSGELTEPPDGDAKYAAVANTDAEASRRRLARRYIAMRGYHAGGP